MDATPPIPAVVLAAGEGRRFGAAGGMGPKVLASLDGRPLLAHVVDVAETAGLDPVVVVIGPDLADDARLRAALEGRPSVRTLVNVRADLGMGASLAAGLAHLAEDDPPGACVVLLGDQPRIDARVVTEAVAAWRATGRPARARYADGPSHPVVLPSSIWSSLADGTSTGARDLLERFDVTEVTVTGHAPRDVDLPVDLDALDRDGGR